MEGAAIPRRAGTGSPGLVGRGHALVAKKAKSRRRTSSPAGAAASASGSFIDGDSSVVTWTWSSRRRSARVPSWAPGGVAPKAPITASGPSASGNPGVAVTRIAEAESFAADLDRTRGGWTRRLVLEIVAR